MTVPTPPRRPPGRPPGEPREHMVMRLPTRVCGLIRELVKILPTHPNGKRWTRTDVVCQAVEDLHRRVTAGEGPLADHPSVKVTSREPP